MFSSRIHLVLGLAALMLLTASVPGAPVPAVARVLLEIVSPTDPQLPGLDGARPEPIEVEPDGL